MRKTLKTLRNFQEKLISTKLSQFEETFSITKNYYLNNSSKNISCILLKHLEVLNVMKHMIFLNLSSF